MIFASQCHKLLIFWDKNWNVCTSLITVRKDAAHSFSNTDTQLKFSKNESLSCLLTFSEDFCITVLEIVYSCEQKSKMSIRVSHQSEKTWPTSFHIRSHSSKLSKNWLTQLSVNIFRWFLNHKVTNSSCFQTKNKMSAKVSPQSEQTQGTSFHLKVTHSKFLPVRENWQLHSLLTFSDGFCITESSFTHSVTQKSKSVQKCQNKLCRPRVPVVF